MPSPATATTTVLPLVAVLAGGLVRLREGGGAAAALFLMAAFALALLFLFDLLGSSKGASLGGGGLAAPDLVVGVAPEPLVAQLMPVMEVVRAAAGRAADPRLQFVAFAIQAPAMSSSSSSGARNGWVKGAATVLLSVLVPITVGFLSRERAGEGATAKAVLLGGAAAETLCLLLYLIVCASRGRGRRTWDAIVLWGPLLTAGATLATTAAGATATGPWRLQLILYIYVMEEVDVDGDESNANHPLPLAPQ